jgi:protein-S-isoprenylcysteine O-methyltransferase Ste14
MRVEAGSNCSDPSAAIASFGSCEDWVDTIASESRKLTAALGPSSASWLSRVRAARGYDTAVRLFGAGWFFMLAYVVAQQAVTRLQSINAAEFSPNGWPPLGSSSCLFLFYLVLCWVMLVRSPPVARTEGVLPSIVAFAGTYLPWAAVLFAPAEAYRSLHVASALLLLIGTIAMVSVILYLGRSFSIVPQASVLVRTGPYSFVRNPLYLVEEVALAGTLLQFYSPVTLVLFLAQGVLQICRIFYEECLLRQTFPDYDDYAKSTSRLIPHVW